MTFSNFTEETKPYLKSLRYLKDFVSFDIYLKSSWGIPKKYTNGVEVMTLKKLNFGIDDNILKLEETIDNGEEPSGHGDLAQEGETKRPKEREEVQR